MPTISENQLPGSHLLYPKQESTKDLKLNLNFDESKLDTDNSENDEFNNPISEIFKTIFVSFVFFIIIIFVFSSIIIGQSAINAKNINQNLADSYISNDEIQIRNRDRIFHLKTLKVSLQNYYNKYFYFPSAADLEKELIKNNFIEKINQDPINKIPFKYSYAVYDNTVGVNQSYILSSALEGQNQTITIYSIGSPTIYHRDFRDVSKSNVKYIEEKFDKVHTVKVKT